VRLVLGGTGFPKLVSELGVEGLGVDDVVSSYPLSRSPRLELEPKPDPVAEFVRDGVEDREVVVSKWVGWGS
jgi:hypothetical protein